ncbi:hypothetical protein QJS10_CPB20g00869 [Acorus calamus]|uniref:Dihydrofolate reductase n=1 Tax=Acorus calamus TaxID=4465 RepID=A0AAV9CDA4_ACOCL|nr:hypothetical protein QJS10_CPB20g00869 [Acorus calamus]
MGHTLGDMDLLSTPTPDIADTFGVAMTEPTKSTHIVTWEPPQSNWAKSNSDGSLADDCGGYGALLRDASISINDVDEVFLVGGILVVPKVYAAFDDPEIFEVAPPFFMVDVQKAYGDASEYLKEGNSEQDRK